MPYAEVFEAFPAELRSAVARLVDALKADLDIKRTDFDALRSAVQELAAAQQRTEVRLDRLTSAVEALAQAQARTQDELTLFRRTFLTQIGGVGARWGLQTEAAFRSGMRAILEEVGCTTERSPGMQRGRCLGTPNKSNWTS
jgi:hypothetical protein